MGKPTRIPRAPDEHLVAEYQRGAAEPDDAERVGQGLRSGAATARAWANTDQGGHGGRGKAERRTGMTHREVPGWRRGKSLHRESRLEHGGLTPARPRPLRAHSTRGTTMYRQKYLALALVAGLMAAATPALAQTGTTAIRPGRLRPPHEGPYQPRWTAGSAQAHRRSGAAAGTDPDEVSGEVQGSARADAPQPRGAVSAPRRHGQRPGGDRRGADARAGEAGGGDAGGVAAGVEGCAPRTASASPHGKHHDQEEIRRTGEEVLSP